MPSENPSVLFDDPVSMMLRDFATVRFNGRRVTIQEVRDGHDYAAKEDYEVFSRWFKKGAIQWDILPPAPGPVDRRVVVKYNDVRGVDIAGESV